MILPHYSYLLSGLIPDARVKIYPDAAHGFLFQHHAESAHDVETFLAETQMSRLRTIRSRRSQLNGAGPAIASAQRPQLSGWPGAAVLAPRRSRRNSKAREGQTAAPGHRQPPISGISYTHLQNAGLDLGEVTVI